MTHVPSAHLSHGDVEGCLSLTQPRRHVHTVHVGVESLAEHHAIEGAVKLYPHLEMTNSKHL